MRVVLLILIVGLVASCTVDNSFTQSDTQEINRIRRDYVNGWLANDRETVLGLFTADATIIPSGQYPLTGQEEIEKYWFPNDNSETTIHSYAVELIELQGTDSMAYTIEKGVLNFTYTNGDFTMTKESTSHATSVYRKSKEGSWKIVSRMWTSLNE
ncbi:nuclear transport factor 2 family protein [Ekhidna sp.]|uniref:YybH family protein n=1 Tax=Ekhidna sp. TaxID=2608089 RepID=UPI003298222C